MGHEYGTSDRSSGRTCLKNANPAGFLRGSAKTWRRNLAPLRGFVQSFNALHP